MNGTAFGRANQHAESGGIMPQKVKQIEIAQEVLGHIQSVEMRLEALVSRVVGPGAPGTSPFIGSLTGAEIKPAVLDALGRSTDVARDSLSRISQLIDRLEDSL